MMGDISALLLSVIFAFHIRFTSELVPIFKDVQDLSFYLHTVLVLTPFYALLFYALGNYQERHGRMSQYEAQHIVYSLGVFYLLCLASTFVIHSQEYSRITVFLAFFLNVLLCIVFRAGIVRGQLHRWKRGLDKVRLLLIGGDPKFIEDVHRTLTDMPETGYDVVGVKVIQGQGAVDVDYESTDRILIVGGQLSFNGIADLILDAPKRIHIDFIPTFHLFLRQLPFKEYIGNYPVLPLNQQILSSWNAFAKRLMDIVISVLTLIFLAPFMIAIAVVIRLAYGKPILFPQERVGQNGQMFTLYKFRTMKPDSDQQASDYIASHKQTIFKWKNDPRVEGRFAWLLRRSGFDELPQLWNVLEGNMSLVGPRPPTRELVRNYSAEHKLRLAIQPGITGLQQVYCRGTDSMEEILRYDFQYIKEQSLWLDLTILAKTISTLLLGKGVS